MSHKEDDLRSDLLATYDRLALHDVNEAETRVKLIDRILYEVLGWTHDDISYEERASEDGTTTYADYVIRTANTACIIEAKRVGATFELPSSRRKTVLSGSLLQGSTGEAIRQVRDYCRKKSVPYAGITNGAQWVLFPAIRVDQVSFKSSTAIVFESLEACLDSDHQYFRSLLSRDGVINGELETELIGRNEDQLDERRLRVFYTTSATPSVNPIYPLIESAIHTAFSDSIFQGDSDLIEKCYVKNADRTKFDNRIQMHLSKRAPLFHEQPQRPMRKKESTALQDALELASTKAKPLAILILGPVGVGKTTFIEYTRRITAAEFFEQRKDREYPHWIYIDFRNFSPGGTPLDFIVDRTFEYMRDDPFFSEYNRAIRSAYKEDIDALKRGPLYLLKDKDGAFEERITNIITTDYENRRPYVEKLLSYASKKLPVFLVIDNVDQFEEESIQATIFSDAIAFASLLGLSLVLSMRESTYVEHRHSAIFDAFDFDPIQLEAPEIRQVLARRFFVAHQLLAGKSGNFLAPNGARFEVEDLSVFVGLVKESVLGTEVGKRIDVLASRDVRLALRMTREFLERGYTDPAKALRIYHKNHSYTLPKHEAFRAILLSNQPVYSEEYSVIGNPIDAHLGKNSAQMLRLFSLSALVRMSSEKTFEYVDGPTIRKTLRDIGFGDDHIRKVLEDLCRFRFLHTASHGKPNFKSNFYPSRLGGYLIRELLGDFTYVENIMMDTFIASDEVWEKLRDLSDQVRGEKNTVERLKQRLRRVKVFYKYVQDSYQQLRTEAQRRGLSSEWCGDPLKEMRPVLRKNCIRALRSAKKYYS